MYLLFQAYRKKTDSELKRERRRWVRLERQCQCAGTPTETGKVARGRLRMIEQVQRERMMRAKGR